MLADVQSRSAALWASEQRICAQSRDFAVFQRDSRIIRLEVEGVELKNTNGNRL